MSTTVERVHPEVQENGAVKWDVQVRQVDKPDAVTEPHYFDAVFVCNGIYHKPLKPDLPGLGDFKGIVMHSREFRVADPFCGKTVIVVGAGPSGVDIGCVVSNCAKQVYLSHNSPIITETSTFPENMKPVTTIRSVTPTSVILSNDEEIEADAILLCTGYRYSFPFLSEACHPKVENERVFPLYKHITHAEFPTLNFIMMTKLEPAMKILPIQVELATSMLFGKIPTPSKEQMLEDIQQDYDFRKSLGLPDNHMHDLCPAVVLLTRYCEEIESLDNGANCITPIPRIFIEHMDHQILTLVDAPHLYRRRRYPLDTDWSKIPCQKWPF